MKHKQVMSHDISFHALLDFFFSLNITFTIMKNSAMLRAWGGVLLFLKVTDSNRALGD